MPAFADRWRRASRAIDRHFGEAFVYRPMRQPDGGGRPIADPERPIVGLDPDAPFIAALTEKPTFAFPASRSLKAATVAQEATQQMMIDMSDDALPFPPQTGDRLEQVATGALFQVDGPQPDGICRTELRVFKLRSGTGT